jgi:hypothetical protein
MKKKLTGKLRLSKKVISNLQVINPAGIQGGIVATNNRVCPTPATRCRICFESVDAACETIAQG